MKVKSDLLELLTCKHLEALCGKKQEFTSGTKKVLMGRLQNQLKMKDLSKEQLKHICQKRGLSDSGKKEELIKRICPKADGPRKKKAKATHSLESTSPQFHAVIDISKDEAPKESFWTSCLRIRRKSWRRPPER